MTRPHTADELRARLLQVAGDSSWAGWQRMYAQAAARDDAERDGFLLNPADLSNASIRLALEDLYARRRAEAFGEVTPELTFDDARAALDLLLEREAGL